jgi:p-aminobenzoyl-glutamate transporter AbgT
VGGRTVDHDPADDRPMNWFLVIAVVLLVIVIGAWLWDRSRTER